MSIADLRLTIVDRREVAAGVVRLALEAADGRPLPVWEPGAHVDVVLTPDLVRQYSLCGDRQQSERWEVAVLREPTGRGGSAYLHDQLTLGDQVRVRGPRNHFQLRPGPDYLFIAGGIGITPLIPMLAAASAAGASWRLVYGGRTRSSMAFADQLTADHPSRVDLVPEDEYGRLDLAGLLDTPTEQTQVYCCGPGPLLDAVIERMARWPPGSLHIERFTVEPAPALGAADEAGQAVAGIAFEVELALSGRILTVDPGDSVLEAVEKAGVPALFSCREGTCGTCETVVLDGVPDHRDHLLTDAERAANDCMMICVSRAHSARLVLEL